MMHPKKNMILLILILFITTSCSVATKNKRHTVAILNCYDREFFDFRKKYNIQEKKMERRNKRNIRKAGKQKSVGQ